MAGGRRGKTATAPAPDACTWRRPEPVRSNPNPWRLTLALRSLGAGGSGCGSVCRSLGLIVEDASVLDRHRVASSQQVLVVPAAVHTHRASFEADIRQG